MPVYDADDIESLGNNFFNRQVAPFYMQGRYYFSGEKCFGKRIEDYVWPITVKQIGFAAPAKIGFSDGNRDFYLKLLKLPKFKVHKVNVTDFHRHCIESYSKYITLDEIKLLLLAAGFSAVKVRNQDWKVNTTYSAFHAIFSRESHDK